MFVAVGQHGAYFVYGDFSSRGGAAYGENAFGHKPRLAVVYFA